MDPKISASNSLSVGEAAAEQGHDGVLMALHWLTALVVVIAFILGPGGSETRVYSAPRDFERSFHEVLGLTVLGLTVLRLAWRFGLGALANEGAGPPWMDKLAHSVRVLLYLLLLITPVSAIVGAWLEGHPLTLGVLGQVPPLLPLHHDVGSSLARLHGFLGDAILWVAGLHAAAALFHHFVLKDQVLRRMLPGLRRHAKR
jgi:cytochrome b561